MEAGLGKPVFAVISKVQASFQVGDTGEVVALAEVLEILIIRHIIHGNIHSPEAVQVGAMTVAQE